LLLVIWGLRVMYRTIARGMFFCRKCGGDRGYRRRAGRRYMTLFFIPVVPLTRTGEHVQCVRCKTRYVTEVLRVPTAARMRQTLPAGTRALVTAMLRAGDPANTAARRRAIEAVTSAGACDYDDAALDADLAAAEAAPKAVAALGDQLQVHAREWYLAEVIRIAMADGPLTGAERAAAESLAAALGLTRAQTVGVITLTEQGAGQNLPNLKDVRHAKLIRSRLRVEKLVSERLVDGDHVLVDRCVPGHDAPQAGLGRAQPLRHRGLDQQAEPVPAVLAGDGGDLLVPPLRVLGVDLDLSERRHLAGRVVHRGDPVAAAAEQGARLVDTLPDPPCVPAARLVARVARRVAQRAEHRRYAGQVFLRDPVGPCHERVPGRRPRRALAQLRELARWQLVEDENPPGAG
jgi:hypothetical protein